MRHAGVVYPEAGGIVAHGKKLVAGKQLLDRGETHTEGALDAAGEGTLAHINFPYNAGDVILIASEAQGVNKIEPVMTYATAGREEPYDPRASLVGASNVRLRTSSGYSPHLYPEHITGWEYYYGAAPRPGFMGRFVVGEDGVRAPYWPTSRTSFGGQIGASANGDTPGDIYRLLGGVVVRSRASRRSTPATWQAPSSCPGARTTTASSPRAARTCRGPTARRRASFSWACGRAAPLTSALR